MAENINLTDAELDSIMERIQKLLHLRDHPSASVGEAANAAAMIQKLLAQYNLTLSEVEAKGIRAKPNTEYGRVDFDLGVTQGYQLEWRSQLMWAITRYNWSRAIRTGSRMHMIGKPHNVRVCIDLYEYLVVELDRLSRQALRAAGGRSTMSEYASRQFKMSFIKGALYEIETRLAAQYRESQSTAGMNALMVVSNQALSTEVAKHFPNLKNHRGSRMGGNESAFVQGRIAGRNISLTPTRKIEGQAQSSNRRLGR